jgi:nicotinate-nucleotide adenylyltransferase
MRIALFGGTFDPVHLGHVNAAKEVLRQNLIDEVWFIPVYWHAFKENFSITGLEHRKRMIELSIEGEANLKVLDFNENPTYALATIEKAKAAYSGNEFFWLMGTNLVEEFSSWEQPEKVLQEVRLILFPVPGSEHQKSELIDSSNPIRVEDNAIDLSSTVVREKLLKGEPVEGLVSERVLSYIKEKALYKNGK